MIYDLLSPKVVKIKISDIDKKEVELYEQRKFAILDRVSDLENAEEKGKQIGEKEEKIKIAKNLLDILDVDD